MKRLALALGGLGFAAVAACAPVEQGAMDSGATSQAADGAAAAADLRDARGRNMGSATATQIGDSIRIKIDGVGLPPGAHGAHVHAAGLCAAPAFESAGPHWNPSGRQHGKENPAGMHMGDLPNILIGADGRGSLEYTIPGASLAQMMDADGAALVVHAQADDNRTDPSGNSGARIACGRFG